MEEHLVFLFIFTVPEFINSFEVNDWVVVFLREIAVEHVNSGEVSLTDKPCINIITYSSAPPSKNAVSSFQIHTSYFLLPWKIPEEISRLNKCSIYHIKHAYDVYIHLQPYTTVVD